MASSDTVPVQFRLVRTFKAAGQVEGMVVHPSRSVLYLGEEQGGIFSYSLRDTAAPRQRIPLSGQENSDLQYDIEGLAIYHGPDGDFLLSSSQGNNRYALYDVAANHEYKGFFQVSDGLFDGSEETDGIDVFSGALGAKFPFGLFVCQDGYNKDSNGDAVPQNFKLVDWRQIAAALHL